MVLEVVVSRNHLDMGFSKERKDEERQPTSNLNSPTGGLAKGIPVKTSAIFPPETFKLKPIIVPYLVFTTGSSRDEVRFRIEKIKIIK